MRKKKVKTLQNMWPEHGHTEVSLERAVVCWRCGKRQTSVACLVWGEQCALCFISTHHDPQGKVVQ